MKQYRDTPAIRWTHILIFLVVIVLAILVAEAISQGLYNAGGVLQLQTVEQEQQARSELRIL